jgi:AraC-like DNA-binding protein
MVSNNGVKYLHLQKNTLMICKRFFPSTGLSHCIREYIVVQLSFKNTPPIRPYPANPEDGIRFLFTGNLLIDNLETKTTTKAPAISFFGQPTGRQNLQLSQEYLMFLIRFQPGTLFKLYRVPMSLVKDQHIDATAVIGKEITELYEQLGDCLRHDVMSSITKMIGIAEKYFLKKLTGLENNSRPVDDIPKIILQNPQAFNLEKMAKEACLSYKAFEYKFEELAGITPKHFARIARFYEAFSLRENNPQLDWLSIAVRTGYNDYQHLVKDFRKFAGTTPNIFLKQIFQGPTHLFSSTKDFKGV